MPNSLIILAFKKKKIWIALLFKYQNIQLTQLISVTNSSQKNGNLDSGFQRFLNPRPMQLISEAESVLLLQCNCIASHQLVALQGTLTCMIHLSNRNKKKKKRGRGEQQKKEIKILKICSINFSI